MRTRVAISAAVVAVAATAGLASATPPPEVRPAPARVVAAASFIANKPTAVYCGRTIFDWATLIRSVYGDTAGLITYGFARIDEAEAYLSPTECAPLEQKLAGRPVAKTYAFGRALLTLTHEAMHLRGIRDEGEAECAAVRAVGDVARRFFGIRKRATLIEIVWNVRTAHLQKPAEYRAVC